MNSVISKNKEKKKKWNDASRKRIKEKKSSDAIKRSSMLEKQRLRKYCKQNRYVITEKRKVRCDSNQLKCKNYYQQNASKICLKRKVEYKRKCGTKSNTTTKINLNKRSKFCHNSSFFEEENQTNEEECHLPQDWDQSEMESLVQKIREKYVFLHALMGTRIVTGHMYVSYATASLSVWKK